MSNESQFVLFVKENGIAQVRSWLNVLELWGNPESLESQANRILTTPKPAKQLAMVEELGNQVQALVPAKKRGRPLNPNSVRSRVHRATIEYMRENRKVSTAILFTHLSEVTGLPVHLCRANASQLTGIKRNNGEWTLHVDSPIE